jgi:hypothetical protein
MSGSLLLHEAAADSSYYGNVCRQTSVSFCGAKLTPLAVAWEITSAAYYVVASTVLNESVSASADFC